MTVICSLVFKMCGKGAYLDLFPLLMDAQFSLKVTLLLSCLSLLIFCVTQIPISLLPPFLRKSP